VSIRPWMKWYPSDWRSDPALRVCSLAARGLWIEMLGLMHDAKPYGHLLVGLTPPTDAQLAVLAGTSPDQIPDLIGELESAGVFSRTGNGVIYSRRMTRDEKKARTAQKNGRNGGNPSLGNQKGNQPSVKGQDKPQKPEARNQTSEKKGEANASPKKQGRATRLSEDWSLPMAWGRWALSEGWPEAVIREQADTFRDYWISASGKNATKLDWEATWRNWMRRVPKHHSNGGSNGRRTPVGSADPGFADRLARWDELDARASQAPGHTGYADFDADGDDGWSSADDRWSDRPGGFGTVVPLLQARGG